MLGIEDVGEQLILFYTSYPKQRRHNADDSRQEYNTDCKAEIAVKCFSVVLELKDQHSFCPLHACIAHPR